MQHFVLMAHGRNRTGIVAGVSEALLAHGGNIEDSQMAILGGHFTMMLVIAGGPDFDADGFEAALARAGLGLEFSLSEAEVDAHSPVPSHIVALYGADHPGIVHAAASVLAERGVDITDLETSLTGGGEQPLYALFMEVALPPGERAGVEAALAEVGRREGVEVTLRELEQDAL